MRRRVPFIAGVTTVAALVATAVAGCTGSPSGREPAIEITELDGPFDPLGIRIVGLEPGGIVTLVAEAHIDWVAHRSLSRFQADSAGVVDLSHVVPTNGAWSRPDAMAPFWSLEPDGAPVAWSHFDEEHTVQLTVIGGVVENRDAAAGKELASARVVRGIPEDSIVVETDASAGLPAVYAAPADLDERSPRPALLVMGGSEGGILVHGAILAAGAGELWCGYPDYSRSAWTLEGVPLPCSTAHSRASKRGSSKQPPSRRRAPGTSSHSDHSCPHWMVPTAQQTQQVARRSGAQ